MADHLSVRGRRALMRRVRTRDTAPELKLRRAMWGAGLRGWRTHPRDVFGRPDIVWKGLKLAVFVDGAFWHGHPDHYWGQSGEFWDQKIARNIARDKTVTKALEEAGWFVVRVWDFELEGASDEVVAKIQDAVLQRRSTEFQPFVGNQA